jgi:hypothetical protein
MGQNWYQKLIAEVGIDEARRRARERANARNAANREKVREYRRAYYARNPEKWRKAQRKRYRRENSSVRRRPRARRSRKPSRLEVFARYVLNMAVRKGFLHRPKECSQCGAARRIAGHHADYMRPLDVEWLCYPCHAARHPKEDVQDAATG